MIYPWPDSDLSLIDGFCGAGGSSLGCEYAGARVKLAMNHNANSLATHAHNFPHALHAMIDISVEDPRRFPHATMAWFSPECKRQSTSAGVKLLDQQQLSLPGVVWTDRDEDPFTERSRATMWDVFRWADAKKDQGHPFQLIYVENVTKVVLWKDYRKWLHEMTKLGYCFRTISYNSMFAPADPCPPVPQSRDRWYTVFWRKGNPSPDLDIRPVARCQHCSETVQAIQCWKRPSRPYGEYRRQYIYCCPRCAREVIPTYTPASTILDWNAPMEMVGDPKRKRKLKASTRENIAKGIVRYCSSPQTPGLLVPPGFERTFLMSYYKNPVFRSVHGVIGTCTSKHRHALVSMPAGTGIPEVSSCRFRMLNLGEIRRAMGIPSSYHIVSTSETEGVRQCGLAVTPAVAAELMRRGIASLGYQVAQGA